MHTSWIFCRLGAPVLNFADNNVQQKYLSTTTTQHSTPLVVESSAPCTTEVSHTPPPPPPPPPLTNCLHGTPASTKHGSEKGLQRSNLFDQISAGIKLNPVTTKTSRSNSKASIEEDKGLEALIMDALARFREDISFSDEEEGRKTDEGSDWSGYE